METSYQFILRPGERSIKPHLSGPSKRFFDPPSPINFGVCHREGILAPSPVAINFEHCQLFFSQNQY